MTTEQAREWTPVHRIVFPDGRQPQGVESLYFAAHGSVALRDRRSIRIDRGTRVSFATYFGAVPTAVWRARTEVSRLRLRLALEGSAGVSLHATDAQGQTHRLWAQDAAGDGAWEVELDEHCGGWLWFEIEASSDAVLSDAVWEAPASARALQTASVAITTHNRVADCLGVLSALAADPGLQERVRMVFVVDQGNQRLRDDARFSEVMEPWGARLVVREQDNLGGSGGFSRGMIEAEGTDATHVLLLDDDVVLEPEAIHRLLAFADHAVGTPLVGAQMLSLTDPTVLYSYGERIDRSRFWWGPVAPELAALDLEDTRIAGTPALSRAYDVDFNGWWMCLIPLAAVRAVGAALPLFIKWDDAEFGLRAAGAGFGTVTLPGAAIWHMPWTGKDDGLDWQAYFQLRNRLVAALIHGGRRRARLLLSAILQDLNHVLCLQYGSATVRLAAADDVLDGPDALVPTLREGPARPARILKDAGQVLDARILEDGFRTDGEAPPAAPRRAGVPIRLLRVLGHQLTRADPHALPTVVSREQGKWFSAGLCDAVVLRSATGLGGFLLRRDRTVAHRLILRALTRYARLWAAWPRLQRAYAASARQLASPESWRVTQDSAEVAT